MIMLLARIDPIGSQDGHIEFMAEVVVDQKKAYFIVMPLFWFGVYLA